MSYDVSTSIEKLYLKIKKSEFPLKSDLIAGYKFPVLLLGEGEQVMPKDNDDSFVFEATDVSTYSDNYGMRINELTELVIKYKGILIAVSTGEDNETDYIRIRDGIKKKVKVIEE